MHDDPAEFHSNTQPGRPRNRKSRVMPRTSKKTMPADAIAEKASRAEDISGYFTNKFTAVRPIRRVKR
jgi:hypothetical protein